MKLSELIKQLQYLKKYGSDVEVIICESWNEGEKIYEVGEIDRVQDYILIYPGVEL